MGRKRGRRRRYKNVKHRSHDFRRRKHGIAEEVFASEWEKENERIPWVNGGMGILEALLNDPEWCRPPVTLFRQPKKPWRGISRRDAMVASTVIQWLGTNCGMAFMQKCEREATKREKAKRAEDAKKWRITNLCRAMQA